MNVSTQHTYSLPLASTFQQQGSDLLQTIQ